MTSASPNLRASETDRAPMLDATVVFLLALLLSVLGLQSKSLWFDEAVTVDYARLGMRELFPVVTGSDANMGLYYVGLNLWRRVFGEGEFAMRLPSAIAAALAAGTTVLVGMRLFGRTTGRVAGVLLALNTLTIAQAQNVRSYALVLFLVTLASWLFVMELERPARWSRIAYVLVGTMAVYTHYFAALVLLVHAATLLATRRRAALTRNWLGMAAALLLLAAPEMLFALRTGVAKVGWIPRPGYSELLYAFESLAAGSRALLCLLVGTGIYATAIAIRERRFWPHLFVAAWFLVPVLVAFGVSQIKPIFIAYYFIVCLPGLLLFGASMSERLPARWVGGALALAALWFSVSHLVAYYRQPSEEDWRAATGYLLSAAQPGDAVVFSPFFVVSPFRYYERQIGKTGPVDITRKSREGWLRVWLVIRDPDAARPPAVLQQLRESFQPRYQLTSRREFEDVDVELYVSPPLRP